jgi:cytochrome c oxidase subunit 4
LTEHAQPVDQSQAVDRPHPTEQPHPSASVYLKVAGILGVLTAIEVWVYYLDFLRPLLAPILLFLSALKFGFVAAFYMHLKFDNKLFTAFFLGGLLLAASIALALMTMGDVWGRPPPSISH